MKGNPEPECCAPRTIMTIVTPTGVLEAGSKSSMKHALIAIALAAGLSTGPAAADWPTSGGFLRVQAQKGGPGQGAERNERGRDTRQNRPDERRERMTQDERQALHRDLDKANREIYGGRRPQK